MIQYLPTSALTRPNKAQSPVFDQHGYSSLHCTGRLANPLCDLLESYGRLSRQFRQDGMRCFHPFFYLRFNLHFYPHFLLMR